MSELEFDKSLLFIPDGVKDVYGNDCRRRDAIEEMIRREMRLYGFNDIKTPSFEFFDIFNKERGTVSSNKMYKFFDKHNNTLVLRPDHTPQIARCVARYYADEEMQLRLCYTGNTYIHQSGYQGKLSETTQIGAELICDSSSDADGEMLTLTVECLKKSGLNSFQIDIGHAGIINGLLEETNLSDEEITKLKTYIDNKNTHAIHQLLSEKDVNPGVKEILAELTSLFGDADSLEFIRTRTNNPTTLDAIDRLTKLREILKSYDMLDYVTFDPGMLSRYDYYTGVIFKAYTYGTGEAIATGGRYDNLMSQFGKNAPAVGVVFLLDQLMEALDTQKIPVDLDEGDILVLYRSANRSTAIDMVSKLRSEGKSVFLMRKNADISLEEYKAYGKRRQLSKINYIDDTGEVTVFNLTEEKSEGEN
ncbi:MAG: ATP phosphoribosyltransferase regulatory subunit [Eubacterium sp.]|nr:ATP phosphoribosyltransferase regulatory subunit [Eubacterium sp.]